MTETNAAATEAFTANGKTVKRRSSMRFRLFCCLAIGILIAGTIYIALRFTVPLILSKSVFTAERKERILTQYLDDLQTFIDKNEITEKRLHLINNWAFLHPDVLLTVESPDEEDTAFYGSNMILRNVFGRETRSTEEIRRQMAEAEPERLRLFDGLTLEVVMEDASETVASNAVEFVSLLAAALSLAATVFVYYHRLAKRISRLGNDVGKVALGDMKHHIPSDCVGDEITLLSENVEEMRSSLLENLEAERAARNSNTELITSLSHDIRTPLTVLLGYVDLMKLQTDDPRMQTYLKSTESTALRLKSLSDDLFRYFTVFGNREPDLNVRNYHAGTLLDQMLTEHTVLMEDEGFRIGISADGKLAEKSVTVAVDAPFLMRIFDNLFSNMKKYADKRFPITVTETVGTDGVELVFTNRIRRQGNPSESNRIGLKTCRSIASAMNVDFSAESDAIRYKTKLKLPLGGAESGEVSENDPIPTVD